MTVITDPDKHLVQVSMDGVVFISGILNVGEPIVVHPNTAATGGQPPPLTVVDTTAASSGTALCRSLLR